MRVISGRAKGFKLKRVPGDKTRPITDRVKENLFNILGNWIVGTYWLDLFAGTGQVGIEALSRGARGAVFVDNERDAIKTIHDNLKHTRLSDGAVVIRLDAFRYLTQLPVEPFDAIYVAPPQYRDIWKKALVIIDAHSEAWLSPAGVVIVQIDPKEMEQVELSGLELVDQRKYGRTLLCFYEPVGSSDI